MQYGLADAAYPKQLYETWRAEADAGRLKLRTFISLASQFPVFMLRKQSLVERLWRGEYLDPTVIGVNPPSDNIQRAIFYDADDVLGFAVGSVRLRLPHVRLEIRPITLQSVQIGQDGVAIGSFGIASYDLESEIHRRVLMGPGQRLECVT